MSATDVSKLEAQLQKLIDDGAPATRILNTAERLLAIQPNNAAGLKGKIVCCLMREKFGAALALLEQLTDANPKIVSTSPVFIFRKAYCYYRLRQYSKAKQLLSSAGGLIKTHIPSRHLQAQIHYNLEEYQEASERYVSILSDGAYGDEQEKMEIITNLSAAYSACEPLKAVEAIRREDEKTYDMCYNAATALIAAKDINTAMKMLSQAEVLCGKDHPSASIRSLVKVMEMEESAVIAKLGALPSNAEATSADRQFFNEVVNIWVQMAYVWQVLGEEDKASQALQLILALKPNSVVTSTVASTNWAGIQGHRDFFEVSRKLKLALNPNTLHRLTSKQLLSLRYNSALLHLQSGSLNNCRRELEFLRRDYSHHYLTHSLALGLTSVEHLKKKKPLTLEECEQAAKLVESAAQKEEKNAATSFLSAQAVIAEVLLQQGDLQGAINAIRAEKGPLHTSPSAICTIAAWMAQIGDAPGAMKYLATEISPMSPGVAAVVLRWAVNYFATEKGLYSLTGSMIEELWIKLSWMRTSKEMAALRCYVLTFTDVEAAQAAESDMGGSSSVKASSYEKVTASQPTRQQLEQKGYRRVTAREEKKPADRVHRRRKMRRPPKNMDGKIDPERWIPMNMRSYIANLPERRKRELRRLRAIEQDRLRRAAEKRKAETATGTKGQLSQQD